MADDTGTMIDAAPATDATEDKPADLGDAGKQAIDRMKAERDAARKEARANAEAAKRLEQIEAEQAKANQTAAEREAAAEQRAAKAEAEALKLSVAFEKGLTPAQAKRLVGGTRDELEADADDILENFPVKKDDGRPKGNADQGVRNPPPLPSDPRAADLAQIEADIAASRRK